MRAATPLAVSSRVSRCANKYVLFRGVRTLGRVNLIAGTLAPVPVVDCRQGVDSAHSVLRLFVKSTHVETILKNATDSWRSEQKAPTVSEGLASHHVCRVVLSTAEDTVVTSAADVLARFELPRVVEPRRLAKLMIV